MDLVDAVRKKMRGEAAADQALRLPVGSPPRTSIPTSEGRERAAAVLHAVWLVLFVVVIGLVLFAVPSRYQMLVDDVYGLKAGLADIGVSLHFFAAYFVFWEIVLVTGSLLVAGVIGWRKADDPFALLVAILLTLLGVVLPLFDGLPRLNPLWLWPILVFRFVEMACLMAVICLFPNGRFQPRWTRWVFGGWLMTLIVGFLTKPDVLADTAVLPNVRTLGDAAYLLVGVVWCMVAIAGQIVRYRRLSNSEERQQTRWVLFGVITMILVNLISTLLLISLPLIRKNAGAETLFVLVMGPLILLSTLLLPVTIALAMLRYRLWEVDIFINRTLVYGGLTALITAVYILFVGVMGTMAANQSGWILGLALATAIVALGIRPLLSRWQTAVGHFVPLPEAPVSPGGKVNAVEDSPPTPGLEDRSPIGAARPWHTPLAVALFLLALASIAAYVALILSACRTFLPSDISGWLESLIGPGGGLAFATVGLIILTKRPANRIGWLCSLGGLGLSLGGVFTVYPGCALAGQISPPGLALTAWFGYVFVPLLTIASIFIFLPLWFPNGRFLSRRWRTFGIVMLALMAILTLALAVTPDLRKDNGFGISYPLDNPLGLAWLPEWWGSAFPNAFNLLAILGSLAAIMSMILRYRRSVGDERQQMKLFAYWTIAAIVQLVVFELLGYRLGPLLVGTAWFDLLGLAYSLILIVVFVGFPVVIGIAIFRYRLYDIDIIINRTLVYGGLSLGIVAVYVLVVGALGALFQARGSFLFALLATGLIAVLFQPVRERLQRGVNRLMFGERDDPYAALSRLGAQLQTADTPEATLQSVVETIAATLKLPYVAIELTGSQGRLAGATTGKAVAETAELPLRYQNELVGYLVVSPRSPGESFTDRERQLLADMAAQSGAMAYSVRLTAALQRSREKLVLTREEERRRIRRDLHDGLGPTLASQTFVMDAILDLLETNPQEAARLVRGLKSKNQETVAEIRRLVYELRPPALDELGLVGALEAHVAQLNHSQKLQIQIATQPDPLPPLSAAVEVAAYRIALEGITNVVRHANARHCDVCLRLERNGRSDLVVEVGDDGIGISPEQRPGVGLNSMRERSEELGGSLVVKNGALGTVVTARLPLVMVADFSAATNKSVHIRPAGAEDYPVVIEIIGEAAAWLKEKGVDQWPSPPNEHWHRRTAEQVKRGEFYLAYEGEEAVGTFRLTWNDAYWLDDGLAGYVHRLAIRNHKHHQGLGDVLLDGAIALIRQQERRFVRLDVPADNDGLREYYENRGFVYRGQVEDHDYLGALFEKEL